MRLAALTSTFTNVLGGSGTLSARSHQGFRASRLRLACSVAIASVIAMSIGAAPLDEPSIDAIDPKVYIRTLLPSQEALCLIKLYGKESAFNRLAIGNQSGSRQTYGIPQLKNPLIAYLSSVEQINYGLKYIRHRYPDSGACGAWTHWTKKGWH